MCADSVGTCIEVVAICIDIVVTFYECVLYSDTATGHTIDLLCVQGAVKICLVTGRMTNFLMGKGYWEYVEGEHEEAPELPEENPSAEQTKAMKDWNQGSRKVMYWLSVSVTDTMIGHI